jgi:O-antigen/teichoic acid export membrane protein
VAFRKELQFNKDFNLFLANRLTSFLVTIPLAITFRNYWALVVGTLVGRAASVAVTYALHPFRPRFSLGQRGDFFHFGKWLVASTVVNVLATRSSDFLIGKTAGVQALGVYSVSYELANLPTTDLVAPINRAILPGYAKKATQLSAVAASYLQVIGLIAAAVAPAAFGIAAVAHYMVPVVLGPRWLDAAPVMATLAFFGMLLALKSNNHYVYLALGKPRMSTMVGFCQIVILLPLLAWGSLRGGALGAAQACVLAEALFSPISMAILRRELSVSYLELYRPFVRPLLAGAAMYGVVRLAEAEFPADGGTLAQIVGLLSYVLIGAVAYPAVLLLLWLFSGRPSGTESRLLEFLYTKLWPRIRDLRFVHR